MLKLYRNHLLYYCLNGSNLRSIMEQWSILPPVVPRIDESVILFVNGNQYEGVVTEVRHMVSDRTHTTEVYLEL